VASVGISNSATPTGEREFTLLQMSV